MTELNKEKIKASVTEVWTKLEQAIQKDLNDVLEGNSELTASTTASVTKFVQLSNDMAKDPEFSGHNPIILSRPLPTFDDETNYN